MCPPDTWTCRRTDFPPTSEDLRDYCTRSRIKGIHKSVEPEIIRLHSNRDPLQRRILNILRKTSYFCYVLIKYLYLFDKVKFWHKLPSIVARHGCSRCCKWALYSYHDRYLKVRPDKVDSLFPINHFPNFDAGGRSLFIIHYDITIYSI